MRELRLDYLLHLLEKMPPTTHSVSRLYGLGGMIIRHFLGPAWVKRHVFAEKGESTFFLDLEEQRQDVKHLLLYCRVSDFAEMLFNLQRVEGFEHYIEHLRSDKDAIEGRFCELEVARFLMQYEKKFRFVNPVKVRGLDYDFKVTMEDGVELNVEAKCKIDSTNYSPETIDNTLKLARDQLNKSEPGVVFLKYPMSWARSPDNMFALIEQVDRFLTRTGRIVDIYLYTTYMDAGEGMYLRANFCRRFHNEGARFKGSYILIPDEDQMPAVPPDWIEFVKIYKHGLSEKSDR